MLRFGENHHLFSFPSQEALRMSQFRTERASCWQGGSLKPPSLQFPLSLAKAPQRLFRHWIPRKRII